MSITGALLLLGLVGAAQWNSSVARAQLTSSAHRILVSQAEALQREHEELRSRLATAAASLLTVQEQSSGSLSALDQINAELAAVRLAGGLSPLIGPGVVVEMADSTLPVPPEENGNHYLVLADDVRDLVTALWASGAEAIAISGGAGIGGPSAERLVNSTSIYAAGGAILINGVPLSPPYRIEAIGADLADRFSAHPAFLFRLAPRIERYGLQFAYEARDELSLPQFIGNTQLRWGSSHSGAPR